MANGNDLKWNAAKEVINFSVAEFASIGVAIGAFTFVDELAPSMMGYVSKVIGKVCVEPFLDKVEWGLQHFCKSKDCQPDFTKSRSERAEGYARYLTRFGLSAGVGLATEVVMRNLMNNHVLKVDKAASNLQVCGLDKGVHLGLIAVTNTIAASHADAAIDSTSALLQKTLGWHKDRADRAADVTVRWELPNWVSWLVTSGYISSRQLSGRNKG